MGQKLGGSVLIPKYHVLTQLFYGLLEKVNV